MKQLLLLLLYISLFGENELNAQRAYWGVAFAGGNDFIFNNEQGYVSYGLGVIYKTDQFGKQQQVVHSFDTATGIRPDGLLTEGNNGKLYGYASQGAALGGGCLYELDPVTFSYRVVKDFSMIGPVYDASHAGPNGGQPLLANNGKLYGAYTIADNVPVPGCSECPPVLTRHVKLFEYNTGTDQFTDVYSFPDRAAIVSGTVAGFRNPPGGLSGMMQASNGKIYISFPEGLEEFGGFVTSNGRLYEFTPGSNQVRLLYNYPNSNGTMPVGNMVEYSPGVLYNTFSDGSSAQMNKGGIHKYDIASNTMTIVAFVDTITGAVPSGTLVKAGNKFYGTTTYGGWATVPWIPYYERQGIIFEFDPVTSEIKKLYDFSYEGMPTNIDSVHNPFYPNLNYYTDANGLSLNLLGSDDTLFGISKTSMFWYKISTRELKSLFNFAGPNGYFQQTGTGLIQTCTKPYYTLLSSDTIIYVQPGTAFSYLLHTPNSSNLQWQKNEVLINETDSLLHFNSFTAADTGSYTCRLSNECGSIVTKRLQLKIAGTTPVALLNVTVIRESNNALLRWQTATEYNSNYFEIQRSTDGIHFTVIGRENAAGNSNYLREYHFTDDIILPASVVYYRLKQVDISGQFIYSNIVLLKSGNDAAAIRITVHPAGGGFIISLPLHVKHVMLSVYDSKGSLMKQQFCNPGFNAIDAAGWSSGNYIFKLTDDSGEIVIKKIALYNW